MNQQAIEVWLTQRNLRVVGRVVREDESTRDVDVASLSMRGAQREITTRLAGEGFVAVGRWRTETTDQGRAAETSRLFKAGAYR